jgi:hypothetical protein
MQVDRQVDLEAHLVTLTVSGELGDPDLLELAIGVENDPEVKPEFSLLVDLRDADGRSVTSAGVRELAKRPFALSPASRRAIVVPTELGFGMARVYEALREVQGGAIRVFRDYEEAVRWVITGSL